MPALHLPIGKSPRGACLAAAFYALLLAMPWLAVSPGWVTLIATLLVCVAVLVLEGCRGCLPSALSHVGHCQWTVHRGEQAVPVSPRGRPTLLPWLVFLPFRQAGSGERRDLWVFRDAVTPEQWRQLRVRATICWGEEGT